jgi:hypothetical protein
MLDSGSQDVSADKVEVILRVCEDLLNRIGIDLLMPLGKKFINRKKCKKEKREEEMPRYHGDLM